MYAPLYELTRGEIVESGHYGALAIVDSQGQLIAHFADPHALTYLRSAAKPFQALPFVEAGVPATYQLTGPEIALVCASHSGTDDHVATACSLQAKTGVAEADLLCGVHLPFDKATAENLHLRGEPPTPNRHNCSGKHTGMLAYARQEGWPAASYLDFTHPVQKQILQTLAEMCSLPESEIGLGIDGCSAPNFAVPLYNAALAYARLVDPLNLSPLRAAACETITTAMCAHPKMVSGPGRFDTQLIAVTRGRILAKGGAEGYQGLGLRPGILGPNKPGIGIAIKISDGDATGRALPGVVLEILRQLEVLSPDELKALADFGPTRPVQNWRKLQVGVARPSFQLTYS